MGQNPEPWMPGDDVGPGDKRQAPATERNADAIIAVLRDILPATGQVLEIASGSGEHAVAFARAFPALTFLPSDPDETALRSIEAYRREAELANIEAPVRLDVREAEWGSGPVDAILAINMVHISPWSATEGLIAGAGARLANKAPLYLYGAYWRDDEPRAPSNEAFDANLRARNPEWGIRDLADVIALAHESGFECSEVVEMPANNLSVVLRKI